MYCTNCGSSLPDGSKFCTQCGTPLSGSSASRSQQQYQQPRQAAPGGYQQQYQQPANGYQQQYRQQSANGYQQQYRQQSAPNNYQQQPYARYRQPKPSVGMGQAVQAYFTGYTDFSGRARRSEYWWASLAVYLISLGLSFILPELGGIWTLATLVPGIAICVRRLHDTGKSGWFYLIGLIPVVGQILMLVWMCTDSVEDNEWGPNPKY